MDAILFHPETSHAAGVDPGAGDVRDGRAVPRRAGAADRQAAGPLPQRPRRGIHGAAEWTLRKWGQQAKLKELDAELMKLKDRGDRRWFVNSQGQTFAVIEGPVEFRMGSPPTETERNARERDPQAHANPPPFRHRHQGSDRRAIPAVREADAITIDRYQSRRASSNRFSPDPDGPWIGPDWYTAAHYCNWLSEQEGLPRDQWCYLPNESGAYAEGMSIPADVLERTRLSPAHRGGMGIRLPGRCGHQPILRSLDRPA